MLRRAHHRRISAHPAPWPERRLPPRATSRGNAVEQRHRGLSPRTDARNWAGGFHRVTSCETPKRTTVMAFPPPRTRLSSGLLMSTMREPAPRERAGALVERDHLGLRGIKLQRRCFADHDALAVLFLDVLADGEHADIREQRAATGRISACLQRCIRITARDDHVDMVVRKDEAARARGAAAVDRDRDRALARSRMAERKPEPLPLMIFSSRMGSFAKKGCRVMAPLNSSIALGRADFWMSALDARSCGHFTQASSASLRAVPIARSVSRPELLVVGISRRCGHLDNLLRLAARKQQGEKAGESGNSDNDQARRLSCCSPTRTGRGHSAPWGTLSRQTSKYG